MQDAHRPAQASSRFLVYQLIANVNPEVWIANDGGCMGEYHPGMSVRCGLCFALIKPKSARSHSDTQSCRAAREYWTCIVSYGTHLNACVAWHSGSVGISQMSSRKEKARVLGWT
jgi:hypothetical protein